ncbi:MAG TPA: hypothetical protein PLN96_04190 [Zoogloea sp.]|uniref:hypothetical protein n=1 Tax=Zoogloea sp. TaxID=49181 RepID=UPI002C868A7C|nr:hypothetical protein [Zoogloea sp.]HMV17797.1 hypothetical protein [Rhodocyclaceae bacterium]HMV64129.1 hypothetical protein [Rhodocyclaceae bacterium]HMY50091.1 hypothetical protein [Rhodocyclaceae bacterium]HMZ76507.1 hypothetical protein [Rhodocyclaceae bacterium]HNA69094.1 hypothetical protein [Rhodocyclaceae bacterium]
MRALGWLVLLALAGSTWADESVSICYDYGCAAEARVVYSEPRLVEIRARLALADNAVAERAVLAQVVGQLYRWAGEQSPIHADRAGDFLDDGVDGKMDCIDHAESTTRLLHMLEVRGMLRFHDVDQIRRRTRWLVTQHFSAVIRARDEGAARFVVDSWFGEHGDPAVILPLEEWLDGEGPNVS